MQSAFDHPLLKDHTIQMPTISFLEKISSKPSTKKKLVNLGLKEKCPSGTVLIRRTTTEDLLRTRKHVEYINPMKTVEGHHEAIISMEDIKFYGAQAEMDVFTLPNISNHQIVVAQIGINKGERGPMKYHNTVQFGWAISYPAYGDSLTHFFTLWTSDYYKKTGCFDMQCPGFIQISNVTTTGMVLPQGSGAIKLVAFRDPQTLNWYLARKDNGVEIIGYWPKELFNNLADCSMVQMGGYIYSPIDEPSPPMGSGKLPSCLRGNAAEFRHAQLIRENGDHVDATKGKPIFHFDLEGFYESGYGRQYSSTGYTFQYGGPGGWKKRNLEVVV